MEYILMEKSEGCFLCQKAGEKSDVSNYILYRGERNFVVLNLYPYNPGHLMVAPFRHVGRLEELTREESTEHFEMVVKSTKAIAEALNPGGFNIGINVGKVAGAGLEDHLHTHVVPRWAGDTNFMPVISDTRVVPQALEETYQRLKERMDSL
ncbi:HIT domain-containing protein [Chloroflexota bacterium]